MLSDAEVRGLLVSGEVPGEREALIATAAKMARRRRLQQKEDLRGALGKRKRSSPHKGPDSRAGAGGAGGAAAAGGGTEAGAEAAPLLDGVTFYALESRDFDVLWDVEPWFVVFCEPDQAFVRQLEVFRSERQGRPLRVYHLTHPEGSLESQRYLGAVEREKDAMQRLILAKERMVAPVDARGDQIILGQRSLEQAYQEGALEEMLMASRNNALTRQGGLAARRGGPARTKVVVDIREFMSGLPGVLHQAGLQIVPVTLEVGDYVLSPDIAVERKAIPDLVSSLASGRLYAQAQALSREYRVPVLLIEFDPARAFALGPSDVPAELEADAVSSRLALLVLHFPQLRILWSRSMHHTAAIFRELKGAQDDPDAEAAARVGVPDGDGPDPGAENSNSAAVAMLKSLPGVTEAGARNIMREAECLADILDFSEEDLSRLLGGDRPAKALRDFLHATCPAP